MIKKIVSFIGKTVYVGIDVHKVNYAVVCRCEKEFIKIATHPANPTEFAESLKHWFKGAEIKTAYEAGFSGFVLHRALSAAGIDSIVVNPGSIAVASNDKVKTDKRDAKKIARDLEDGRFAGGIHIPTVEEEQARLLPRTRAQMINTRARVSRQIKSRLHQFGFIAPSEKRMISGRYLRELEGRVMPEELRATLLFLFEQWRFLTKQIFEIRRKIAEQAKAQAMLERVYRSVPGIGEVVARTFATELGDMSRFRNERALFSYTGLTPGENSSGEKTRRGHISRQGSSRIRQLLIEVAWRAIEKDPGLNKIFHDIATRRDKKRAIVAIARKLIGRVRGAFRSGNIYALST